MANEIKFGTDGWRSVIADGFTFENVRQVTQATCDVLRNAGRNRLLLIGYDHRFFSKEFAETAARVATANKFKVELSNAPLSSPALSFQVKAKKAAMGIMITASHNPAIFCGFKLKGPHGGSVDETVTKAVEERLEFIEVKSGDDVGKRVDFISKYLSQLKKYVKPAVALKQKSAIVFDAMHGPGGALFERLAPTSSKIKIIRKQVDPLFGNVNPEPIEKNLGALKEAVIKNKAAVGLAVDGDADRIGLVDNKGRYLPPHTVMPLLLLHLIENRKLKGKVVQTVSMGYLPGRIAKEFKLPFDEVAVGFKHIARIISKEKVVLGGEESGGYGIGLWSPERDGLLCAFLILELLAKKKCLLSDLVDDLEKRFGASHFSRIDFRLTNGMDKQAWTQRVLANINKNFVGYPIKSVNSMDGVKVVTEDDSWVLMRPSGTEPLVRTYSEGTSNGVVKKLLEEADRLVHLAPPPARKKGARQSKRPPAKKAR